MLTFEPGYVVLCLILMITVLVLVVVFWFASFDEFGFCIGYLMFVVVCCLDCFGFSYACGFVVWLVCIVFTSCLCDYFGLGLVLVVVCVTCGDWVGLSLCFWLWVCLLLFAVMVVVSFTICLMFASALFFCVFVLLLHCLSWVFTYFRFPCLVCCLYFALCTCALACSGICAYLFCWSAMVLCFWQLLPIWLIVDLLVCFVEV